MTNQETNNQKAIKPIDEDDSDLLSWYYEQFKAEIVFYLENGDAESFHATMLYFMNTRKYLSKFGMTDEWLDTCLPMPIFKPEITLKR